MPHRGPTTVARALAASFRLDAEPQRLRDVIDGYLQAHGWEPEPTARVEMADRWTPRVLRVLQGILERDSERGVPSRFEFNASAPDHVQRSAFVPSLVDGTPEGERRRRLALLDDYRGFLEGLSPTEFERLCVRVLHLLGVDTPTLTPRTADEGIDFHGRLAIGVSDGVPLMGVNAVAWLIGQAKHYQSTKVATPDLRDLVGAVTLARGQAFGSHGSDYLGRPIRVCDPVFFLFMTTGEISADGWNLIRGSGVVGLDGVLTARLLTAYGVGETDGAFDQREIQEWLDAPP